MFSATPLDLVVMVAAGDCAVIWPQSASLSEGLQERYPEPACLVCSPMLQLWHTQLAHARETLPSTLQLVGCTTWHAWRSCPYECWTAFALAR